MLRIFVRVFSLCQLVKHSLRSSGPGSQVNGYYRMSFQQVIDQDKKHMARVCNRQRERVRSIKTVPFLIERDRVGLSSGETVPTKWRTCQDKIMTTTANTVENQEKTIQNKIKVPQLTNENTNKIAGSNLLKPMQRHRKFIETKVEECNETKAIVQGLKIGRGDEKDVT